MLDLGSMSPNMTDMLFMGDSYGERGFYSSYFYVALLSVLSTSGFTFSCLYVDPIII